MVEKKKLGEILLEAGVISSQQLKEALEDQKKFGGKLGSILLDRRYISEKAYLTALSQQLKIPAIDFSKSTIPEAVIHLVPRELQEKHTVFPVATKRTPRGKTLILAMQDPTNVEVLDEIAFRIGCRVEPAIALETVLREIIREYWYHQDGKGSYHYKPDTDLGGWVPRRDGGIYPGRFIPGERVIDFEAEGKAQEETKPEGEAKETVGAKEETALAKIKPSRELLALLRLLVKKKIITEQEYLEEVKKTK